MRKKLLLTKRLVLQRLLALMFLLGGFTGLLNAQIAQRGTAVTAVNTTDNSASLIIGAPSGVEVGDVLIATIVQNETDNDNGGLSNITSLGWLLIDGGIIRSQGTGNGDNAWHGTVLYRIADGTEGNQFSFSLPNGRSDLTIGSIVAFSGVTSTQGFKADGTAGGPFDIDPGSLNITDAGTSTAIGLTTVSSNAAVVMISMVSNDRTFSGWSATSPASLNELFDFNDNNDDDAAIGAAWGLKPTIGVTGNGVVTLTGNDLNASIMLALKAAVPSVSVSSSSASVCTGSTVNLTSTLLDNPQISRIAFQGFETAGSTMTYTTTGTGGTQTGNTAGGDAPSNSPYAYSGTTGFRVNNGTAAVTTSNVTGLGSYSNKKVTLDLASFSVNNNGNGADAADNVIVAISLDGGTSWSDELRVNGSSANNARWSYLSGLGIASATYDGNGNATVFSPGGGGDRTTDGYSQLEVSLPDNSTQVRIRITLFNNGGNETWAIDHIMVSGTPTPQYSWTSAPAGFTSSAANPSGVTVSANTTYNLTVTDATGFSASSSAAVTVISVVPSVTISSSDADNSICNGTSVTFTATPTNGGTTPSYQWKLNGANVGTNSATYTNAALADGDIAQVVMTSNAACASPNTATSNSIVTGVTPTPTLPLTSSVGNTICAGTAVTFTSSGASQYQFFVDGVSQGAASATSTFNTSTLTNGQVVSVQSNGATVIPSNGTAFVLDGTIEANWGSALATSAGGPSPGFGAGHELNALYASANQNNLYLGVAGNVQSGNRILVWIDSKTGGYTNGNYGRSGAPQGVDDINSGISFDAGFAADYVLVIGVSSGQYFYDLYTLSGTAGSGGGPNQYLGYTNAASAPFTQFNLGAAMGANPANSNNTRGFEIQIPKSLLGYTTGAVQLFAMYTSEGGFLSNQFLSRANSGDGNYTNTNTNFGAANPNPVVMSTTTCPATGSITMTVNPNATIALTSAGSTNNQTPCAGTAITNITYALGGGATGATVSGLPTGVSANVSGGVVTISGTPTATGVFNYTVTTTGTCSQTTATGTLTIRQITYANLQFPATGSVCVNGTYNVFGRVYAAGLTEAAGANANVEAQFGYHTSNTDPSTWTNWSAATWNVQSNNDDEYTAAFNTALAAGTYYYAYRYRIFGCAWVYGGYSAGAGGIWNGTSNVNGQVVLNANNIIALTSAAGTNAQTPCINTAITDITYATTGATGATASGLPAGVSGTWASNVFTISGTPTASGTFNYTVTMTGGCTGGTNTATGTITVSANNTIALTSAVGTANQTQIEGIAITNITYATTEATGATVSGLPTGVTPNWAANVLTISGTPTATGTFNYTVTMTGGCAGVTNTATGTITVTPNAVSLTAMDVQSCQNFNTLPTTGTSSVLPLGWYLSETGTNANATHTAGTGSSNVGDTYNLGATGNADRALGGLLSTTLVPTIGAQFLNNTGNTISILTVSYTGETWRVGGTNRSDRLDFQYSINATSLAIGTWVDENNLDYSNPGQAATGNGSIQHTANISFTIKNLSIAPGSSFWIRWNDFNATGADDAMGVDDVCITPVTPCTASVAIASSDTDNSICSGTSVTFTATPTDGGTAPAYQWKVNGTNVGINSAIYTTTALANGDAVSVVLTSDAACATTATATSAVITNTVNPNNTVGTASSTPTLCINSALTNITHATTGATGIGTATGLPAGVIAAWSSNTITISGTPSESGTFNYSIPLTGGCGTVNATGTITVSPAVTPSVTIASDDADNSICDGTSVTFTATPTNGGSTPAYQWKLNGTNVGTNAATYSTTTLANNDVVTVVLTANNVCQTSATANGNSITTTVTNNVTPSVTIAANTTDICPGGGTSVTFTATPTNGGTPSYQWKRNGNNIGTNSTTFTSTALAGGDVITVVMTATNTCQTANTATSAGTTINALTVNTYYQDNDGDGYGQTSSNVQDCTQPTGYATQGGDCNDAQSAVNPAATEACNTIDDDCDGSIDEGVQTTYYADVDGDTYGNASSTIAACAPPTGYVSNSNDCNDANSAVNPAATEVCNLIDDDCDSSIDEGTAVTPSVAIVSNDADNSICDGTSVTFIATPTNGGSTPAYQWKLNGTNVGTNASTYTNSALASSDVVTVVLTANNVCQTSATANGNSITTTVTNNVTPSVNIAASTTDICPGGGTSVTFTATPTNGGTPSYQWKRNGNNIGTNATTFTSTALSGGDVITVVMTATNTCQTANTTTSAGTTINALTVYSYYLDNDGDGYGNPSTGVSDCANPAGYVMDNTDCLDSNGDVYPDGFEICNGIDDNCDGNNDEGVELTTYYLDNDGDGFGGSTGSIQSCDIPSGFIQIGGDCNDNNANVRPTAQELCSTNFDDDCDGLINEICFPGNDNPTFASNCPLSTSATLCTTITGNLQAATATETFGTGSLSSNPDVWYYFTANAVGMTIRCTPSVNDIGLELRTSSGELLKSMNSLNAVGDEYMNYADLTVGNQYYLRVMNMNPVIQGGNFTLCAKRIVPSSSAFNYTNVYVYNTGCTNVIPTNLSSFISTTIVLTPVGGGLEYSAPGPVAQLGEFQSSTGFGVNYNTVYAGKVIKSSAYPLGDGTTELLSFTTNMTNTLNVLPAVDLDLSNNYICPRTWSVGTLLRADRWICGAVKYQWRFEQYVNGQPFLVNGNPVVIEQYGPNGSRDINALAAYGFIPGSEWRVKVRPVFPNNVHGDYGTDEQCLKFKGSFAAAPTVEQEDGFLNMESRTLLYPNPSNSGDIHIFNEQWMETDITMLIMDASGKKVFQQDYSETATIQESLNHLSNGMYLIQLKWGNQSEQLHWMVQR